MKQLLILLATLKLASAADPLPPLPPAELLAGMDTNLHAVLLSWVATNVVAQEVGSFTIYHESELHSPLTNYLAFASGYTSDTNYFPPLFCFVTETNLLNSTNWMDYIGGTPTTYFAILTNLPVSSHSFQVTAEDIHGRSSVLSEMATTVDHLPNPPRMVSLITTHTEIGATSTVDFRLLWETSPTTIEDQVSGWQVESWGIDGGFTNRFPIPAALQGTNMPAVFSTNYFGLAAGFHSFRVRSVNIWGAGLPSPTLSSPPTNPVKLTATIVVTVQ